MGLPIIDISFKQLAKTVISRSERGIIAMVLKDTTHSAFIVQGEEDIPATLNAINQKLLKLALKGNVNAPSRLVVYVVATDGNLADALTYFEAQEFNLFCYPQMTTQEKTTIKAFINKMNDVVKFKVDAVLKGEAADNEAFINLTAKNVKVGNELMTDAELLARVAGLIEGTPLNQAVTYATLPEVTEIENITKEEADNRVKSGEFILIREMGKVRVARGINSLTNFTETKGDTFSKIKLRKTMKLIHNDLRRVIVEKYIGKVSNNYDNKCVLVTEIRNYLDELAKEQLIETVHEVGIDMEAQKKWLKDNTNLDIANMTDQEIKEANTHSNVFIAINIKLVDAIEDVRIAISL